MVAHIARRVSDGTQSRVSTARFSTPPAVDLEVKSLSIDGYQLFDDLRLELPAGQWTCLLGRSGSGKSTLLRLLCGLQTVPGDGFSVTLSDGSDISRQTAWMAQQDLLLPWCTALDNVLLGARLRGNAHPNRSRGLALLEQVGLSEAYDKLPSTLSGGMRQRVALARTLIEDKPICLLDEPFSNIDAITRHQLQELAFRLLRDKTVLLVTHDPAEALRLGHHITVLSMQQRRLLTPFRLDDPPMRDPGDPDFAYLTKQLLEQLSDEH